MAYQPKTGEPCNCRRGQQRDNCPECEGTGMRIDFRAIRARRKALEAHRKVLGPHSDLDKAIAECAAPRGRGEP